MKTKSLPQRVFTDNTPLGRLCLEGNAKLIKIFILSIFFLFNFNFSQSIYAQCGFNEDLGCPNTNYANFGLNTDIYKDAASIEYDNYISVFHSTIIRSAFGEFMIWGEMTNGNGSTQTLSPTEVTPGSGSYNAMSGIPLKATMGSYYENNMQTFMLTTTGLYVWGTRGAVVASAAIPGNGSAIKQMNLPNNVEPTDVKSLFATYKTLAILTCNGEVWMLSQNENFRGNGGNANSTTTWYRVKTNDNNNPYLTDIIALRGSPQGMVALDANGDMWTWGDRTYLGDNTAANSNRSFASKMTLPTIASGDQIKMIGTTGAVARSGRGSSNNITYYLLTMNGSLWALGDNGGRQLGDWTTTTNSNVWVQPKYPAQGNQSRQPMNDIMWFSPSDHDAGYAFINVINSDSTLYNWGQESGHHLGRGVQSSTTSATGVNPGIPSSATNLRVAAVNSGGHTTMISVFCNDHFGYVGHRVRGSMGDGNSNNAQVSTFSFATAPIQVCGAPTEPQLQVHVQYQNSVSGKACIGEKVTLEGIPGGGIYELISATGGLGNAVLNGNELTYNGPNPGSVTVKYTDPHFPCSPDFVQKTINFETCVLLTISGEVWIDQNRDIYHNATEEGSNLGTGSTPLYANLVDVNGIVVDKTPLNPDGTFQLGTIVDGIYAVSITKQSITVGNTINPNALVLPDGWVYTGNRIGNTINCEFPLNCSSVPHTIEGIHLSADPSIPNASASVTNIDFGIIFGYPTPIDLLSFEAYARDKIVILEWETAQERNNKGFEIQRSSDSKNWEAIGFVSSNSNNGHTANIEYYQYIDDKPLFGDNFYRLKQVDYDDKHSYTQIRHVIFNNSEQIDIYPNPTKDIINITGLEGKEIINIYDNTGRLILTEKTNSKNHTFNIKHLAPGIYQLIITDENATQTSHKLIKIN